MSITTGDVPFPFCVIDNLLPESELRKAYDALPDITDPAWYHYSNPLEEKYALNDITLFPAPILDLLRFFMSRTARTAIQNSLSLPGELVPDVNLLGAGIHRIPRGGKLDIHIDHNRNRDLPDMERKVNAIYWFHPTWKDSWGGSLELWSHKDGKPHEVVQRIEPKPNRLALFKAGDVSFHGHPDPLTCPEGKFRTSLALYFFSKDLEDKQIRHKVHFFPRPSDSPSDELDLLRAQRADPLRAAQVWK